MSYYESELAKAQAELAALENDHSAEAHARRITLADRAAELLSDYADECERRGHHEGAAGLRAAAEPMKHFAVESAQDFLKLITKPD